MRGLKSRGFRRSCGRRRDLMDHLKKEVKAQSMNSGVSDLIGDLTLPTSSTEALTVVAASLLDLSRTLDLARNSVESNDVLRWLLPHARLCKHAVPKVSRESRRRVSHTPVGTWGKGTKPEDPEPRSLNKPPLTSNAWHARFPPLPPLFAPSTLRTILRTVRTL